MNITNVLVGPGAGSSGVGAGAGYEAYALGINSSGELIVKTADGQKREIFAEKYR